MTDDEATLEAFYTPDNWAYVITQRLVYTGLHGAWTPMRTILEPTAGAGAFVKAAKRTWPDAHVTAIEINSREVPNLEAAGADVIHAGDATTLLPKAKKKYDLILTNPPFSLAERLVHLCLPLLTRDGHLAMLLKSSFIHGAGRLKTLWRPSTYNGMACGLECVIPLAVRPSFDGNGADRYDYSVFVWGYARNGTLLSMPPLTLEG
jgi:predicted RNA methylase